MRVWNSLQNLLILTVSGLTACAHSDNHLQIRSEIPLTIYSVSEGKTAESYLVNANEKTSIKEPVSRIEATGYQPMILALTSSDVVERSKSVPVEIKLKQVEDWKSNTTEIFVTKQMDTLYMELLKILDLARKKQVKEALVKADQIIKDYPKLATAYYVKAQVEIFDGNKSKASDLLNAAVSLKPEFKEAISLRAQLQMRGNQ